MRKPIRVAVHSPELCINTNCCACLVSHIGGDTAFVDCAQGACDNHKRGTAQLLPRMPDTPPFELPAGDTPLDDNPLQP